MDLYRCSMAIASALLFQRQNCIFQSLHILSSTEGLSNGRYTYNHHLHHLNKKTLNLSNRNGSHKHNYKWQENHTP